MRLPNTSNRLLITIFLLAKMYPSYAENNHFKNVYFSLETGWSAISHDHVTPYQFKDQKNFAYRLSMGYLFDVYNRVKLGPEIGYGYYGKISYSNPSNLVVYYESYGWNLLANLTYKMSAKMDLALKGGMTEISQHYDIAGPNVTRGGFYQRAFKPTLMLASAYSLSREASIDLSYTRIFANSAPLTSDPHFTFTNVNQITSVNALMVGIVYSV